MKFLNRIFLKFFIQETFLMLIYCTKNFDENFIINVWNTCSFNVFCVQYWNTQNFPSSFKNGKFSSDQSRLPKFFTQFMFSKKPKLNLFGRRVRRKIYKLPEKFFNVIPVLFPLIFHLKFSLENIIFNFLPFSTKLENSFINLSPNSSNFTFIKCVNNFYLRFSHALFLSCKR